MTNNFNVSEVVEILCSDAYLAQEIEKFADLLDLRPSDRITSRAQCTMGTITLTQYLTILLQQWVGRSGNDATVPNLIEILKNGEFINAADQLSACLGQSEASSYDDDLPPSTRLYVGRSEQEKDIVKYKENSNICIIHGPDGIGKTQFVLKTFKERTNFQFFRGDSITNLRMSLENRAKRLGYNISEQGGIKKSLTDLFKYVSRKENRAGLGLVTVIDELNLRRKETTELKEEIANFIKICSTGTKHFLVITSIRRDVICLKGFEAIGSRFLKLPIFENDEADEYVRKNFEHEAENNIRELNRELGNYPLAIHQAVETIKGNDITIETFLADYKSEGLSIDKPSESNFKTSMLSIMRMTMSKIVHESNGLMAVQVLQLLAFMESGRTLLLDLKAISCYWHEVDSTHVEHCIQLLSNFSCIDQDSDKRSVSIHRVIQKVVRLNLRKYQGNGINMEALHLKQFFHKLLSKHKENIPFIQESSQSRLTQLARMWTLFSYKYLTTNHELHEIPNLIYSAYVKLGLFSYAKSFIFQQKKNFTKDLGDNIISTVDIAKNCAIAMRNLGDYLTAEKLFRGVLIDEIKLKGGDHEETLDTEHWIVSMLFRQKRYNEAESAAKHLITKCQNSKYEKLEMKVIQVLAFITGAKGDHSGSLEKHTKVWNWRKKELTSRHKETVASLHNIAQCMYEQGKYDDAFNIFTKIVTEFLGLRADSDDLRSRYWLVMCEYRKAFFDPIATSKRCVGNLDSIIKSLKELGWDDRHPDLDEALKSRRMIMEQINAMGLQGSSSVSSELSNVPPLHVEPHVVLDVDDNVHINGDVEQGGSCFSNRRCSWAWLTLLVVFLLLLVCISLCLFFFVFK